MGLPNRPPIADAGGPYTGETGTPVQFDGSGSYDLDGDSLTYTWNFGDSTPAQTGIQVDHTYSAIGIYQASLEVDDGRGGIGTANFDVTITEPVINNPPVITSSPITSAAEGTPYSYNIEATDPDGDSLIYGLLTSPTGMGIDTVTGLITWIPDGTQAGSHPVEILVRDGYGNSTTQSFAINVAEAINSAPVITSSPPLTIYEVADYSYQVVAEDSEGDPLGFELTNAPVGMIVSVSGLIFWPQGPDRPNSTDVTIRVSDNQGGEAAQSWEMVLVPVPALEIGITVTPDPAGLGDTVIIELDISSYFAVVAETVTVNSNPVPVVNDQAQYPATAVGNYVVEATATDEHGATGTATTTFQVIDPNDTQPPEISVSLPPGLTVEAPYEIIGTISDPALVRYEISLAPRGSNDYRLIADGSSCVENGMLGTIDPTILTNGLYDLRITAYDANGNVSGGQSSEPIEINSKLKIGQFSLGFEDILIPVAGIPLTVTRAYNSFDKEKGDFGVGWDMLLGSGIKVEVTRTLGYNWYADYDYCFQAFMGQCMAWIYKLTTPNIPKVLVTYADGRQDRFEFTPEFSTQPALDPEWVIAAFTPLEGTTSTLDVVGSADLILVGGLAGDTLYDWDMEPFDPDLFRLTTAEGIVYIISRISGLQSITDRNGNTLTFGPDGVTHSTGLAIDMERDSENRITQIIDPEGATVQYSYNDNGDLIAFTNQEGDVTQYGYDYEHNLMSIIDPQGIEVLQIQYDEKGRMIGTVDGLGSSIDIFHDTENVTEYVTDRNGDTTAYEYDSDGNVIAVTDPLGKVTRYTYDDHGNQLSKTDALGNTAAWIYDERDNKLSETDPLGNTTTWTYNGRNQILTETDPLGNVTTYTYDSKGNWLSKTDALGSVISYTYDASGNRTSKTDCEGNVWTYTYDVYGNKITETDPLGNTTTWTYDAGGNVLTETDALGNTTVKEYDHLGNLILTTDPLGNIATTEYNSARKRSAEVDKNGNRTEYEYDANGKLILTRYPDGSTATKTYDANGNLATSTDKADRTTEYEYVAAAYNNNSERTLNRLVQIVHPDGSSIRFEYDAVGRMVATIDENGNRTESAYGVAGRKIRTIDALGNITTFAYDANGNQISVVDANEHTTQFGYDALGRKTITTFPDGTTTTAVYASSCSKQRKLSETDQAGGTTQFQYDPLGRLVQVTDALGNITTYSYDAAGNKLTQTDANGNTTSFNYDVLGRALTRTLPMGQGESFSYDANGNPVSKTDFNGEAIAYTYDSMNRLLRKQYPDASEVAFAFTPTGRRDNVTDARGITFYVYDSRDRMVAVHYPDGSAIEYTYDAKGNRTSVTVPSGTTAYAYDALNRLVGVTDPSAGVTAYAYDNLGNRASVTYPNGTVVTYTYDSLNRLIYLENSDSIGGMISSYTYTLGPAGNRFRVTEDTGRIIDYAYDSLYRLVQEEITDPVLGNKTIDYTYDTVGNRLTKSDSSGVVTYSYNVNDQLITEARPVSTNTYAYDNNGNTVGKSDGVVTTTYGYDYENRLVQAQKGGSTTVYEYDADGIRTASDNGGVFIAYLVDKNRSYAQVLEERDSGGSLLARYVYGDDLISQNRGGMLSYYHYDGQMSTRKLTDTSGNITDSYVYDAFGILLGWDGATENRYLYTGEQYDSNVGFYYLRARYYNQNAGRFMTHDPILGSQFEPVSFHRYLYCNANPLTFRDPSGLCCLTEQMSALSVLSVLVTSMVPTFVSAVAITSYVKLYGIAFELKYTGMYLLTSPSEEVQLLGLGLMQKANRLLEFSERWRGASEKGLKIYNTLLLIQSGFNTLGSIFARPPSGLGPIRSAQSAKVSTKAYEAERTISQVSEKVGVVIQNGGQIRISSEISGLQSNLSVMTNTIKDVGPFFQSAGISFAHSFFAEP